MKYVVIVDGQRYEVELGGLHTQPITALVNGEAVEVWLESENEIKPYFALTQSERPTPEKTETVLPAAPATGAAGGAGAPAGDELRAPLPGVIVSLAVQPGDAVEQGQPVCVIEAMKMKNTLRAPRSGVVTAVKVHPGQSVQHHDLLVEFEAGAHGN